MGITADPGLLIGSSVFLVAGVLLLLRPEKMLRWTARTNPEIASNRFVLTMTRLIGVGFMAMAVLLGFK